MLIKHSGWILISKADFFFFFLNTRYTIASAIKSITKSYVFGLQKWGYIIVLFLPLQNGSGKLFCTQLFIIVLGSVLIIISKFHLCQQCTKFNCMLWRTLKITSEKIFFYMQEKHMPTMEGETVLKDCCNQDMYQITSQLCFISLVC